MSSYRNVALPAIFTQFYGKASAFERDLLKALVGDFTSLEAILNRGFRFEDNADARMTEFTSSGTPNAENTIPHLLGKVPTGYLVYRKDKAAHLYDGTTAWTNANIYLKSDVATVAFKMIVF